MKGCGTTIRPCDRCARVLYFQIELFHTDESLEDGYTLMDVAYICDWRMVRDKQALVLNFLIFSQR